MFGISVQSWMSMNKLKLSTDKAEFLLIRNKRPPSKYISMFPTELFSVKTNPAKCAHDLGVIFDKNFTFLLHESAVCSSFNYHMRDLRCIRSHPVLNSAKVLAIALVSSCLHYCNSLLYGIEDTDLTKSQCVQTQLACIITKSPPFTRSVPLLRSLHWLPVKFRKKYSISVCLTSKSFMKNSLLIFTPCLRITAIAFTEIKQRN